VRRGTARLYRIVPRAPRAPPPAPFTSTSSLPDALPICLDAVERHGADDEQLSHAGLLCAWRRHSCRPAGHADRGGRVAPPGAKRSEEHTSELQSPDHLVCPLLLDKKNIHNVTVTLQSNK